MPKDRSKRGLFLAIYAASFLYAFHYSVSLFVESSFIEQYAGEERVGFLYSLASLLTIILIANSSKILRRFGNRAATLAFIGLEIASLILLAVLTTPLPVMIAFVLHLTVLNAIFFNLDLFLESSSDDESTGSIRGTFLTLFNLAIFIGPFFAGLIMTDGDFWRVFLASAALLAPAIFLTGSSLRRFIDPPYRRISFFRSLVEAYTNKNIRRVFISYFLLNFFYVWMIIYAPIFLHKEIGFTFSEILSVLMPAALLPFIIFQLPLGKLADSRTGEKEILILGLILLAVTTASLSFITSDELLFWAVMLFSTRIGASMVEVMSESYFYKQINGENANLIGAFRNIRPAAFLVAPLVASIAMTTLGLETRFLFFLLGLIVLTGIPPVLSLKDTK